MVSKRLCAIRWLYLDMAQKVGQKQNAAIARILEDASSYEVRSVKMLPDDAGLLVLAFQMVTWTSILCPSVCCRTHAQLSAGFDQSRIRNLRKQLEKKKKCCIQ